MDHAFHDVTQFFDMADMLDQFERLARAREPEDHACRASLPSMDTSLFRSLEPHVSTFQQACRGMSCLLFLLGLIFEQFQWFMAFVIDQPCSFFTCSQDADALKMVISG